MKTLQKSTAAEIQKHYETYMSYIPTGDRQKVIEYVNAIIKSGFVDVSTNEQTLRGTIMFLQHSTGDMYGVYLRSGYVRRLYSNYYGTYMYQLNPVTKEVMHNSYNRITRITFPNDIDKLFGILIKRFSKNSK